MLHKVIQVDQKVKNVDHSLDITMSTVNRWKHSRFTYVQQFAKTLENNINEMKDAHNQTGFLSKALNYPMRQLATSLDYFISRKHGYNKDQDVNMIRQFATSLFHIGQILRIGGSELMLNGLKALAETIDIQAHEIAHKNVKPEDMTFLKGIVLGMERPFAVMLGKLSGLTKGAAIAVGSLPQVLSAPDRVMSRFLKEVVSITKGEHHFGDSKFLYNAGKAVGTIVALHVMANYVGGPAFHTIFNGIKEVADASLQTLGMNSEVVPESIEGVETALAGLKFGAILWGETGLTFLGLALSFMHKGDNAMPEYVDITDDFTFGGE